MAYLWLILSGACSVAASVALKAAGAGSAAGLPASLLGQALPYLAAIGAYGLGFGFYALALRQLEFTDAPCLVSTDDESYTYNNRINRISSIQEHHMLRRAVERGVAADRLAKALNVDISQIHKKVNLLESICPEAAEMLKDQHF